MRRMFNTFALILVVAFLSLPLSACGNQVTEGLEFTALENGTYAISNYTGDEPNVVIPSQHNGIEVSAIGEEAFANSQIQSISGGENISLIDTGAFSSCYMLKDFNVEGKITTISAEAFSDCTNLEEIILPDTLTFLGDSVFENCQSLKSIKIPEGIQNISAYTFAGSSSLESISLPESITSIGQGAFSGCGKLSDIVLPEALTVIGYDAFKNCVSLSSITIPESVQKIKEDAFNTYMTIYVEGSTTGWHGSWCSSMTEIVYTNRDSSLPDAEIKPGTYDVVINSSYDAEQSIYINDGELEILIKSGTLLVGKKYSYDIEGSTLHCTPIRNADSNIEMTYDESSQSIKWDSFTFYWSSSEKTDHYIYYG